MIKNLSKEEVKHIAKLARLGLADAEIGKFQKELSAILDYIEKLKEADISGVEPTLHSVLLKNVTRKDRDSGPNNKGSKLLELAPETREGYLKVKSVLEK